MKRRFEDGVRAREREAAIVRDAHRPTIDALRARIDERAPAARRHAAESARESRRITREFRAAARAAQRGPAFPRWSDVGSLPRLGFAPAALPRVRPWQLGALPPGFSAVVLPEPTTTGTGRWHYSRRTAPSPQGAPLGGEFESGFIGSVHAVQSVATTATFQSSGPALIAGAIGPRGYIRMTALGGFASVELASQMHIVDASGRIQSSERTVCESEVAIGPIHTPYRRIVTDHQVELPFDREAGVEYDFWCEHTFFVTSLFCLATLSPTVTTGFLFGLQL